MHPIPIEEQLLYESQRKVAELEEKILMLEQKLKEKDNEIKLVRKKRFEELEPEILLDKVANARTLKRSREMDEWKTEDLAAWFTELKMEEYNSFIFSNRLCQ